MLGEWKLPREQSKTTFFNMDPSAGKLQEPRNKQKTIKENFCTCVDSAVRPIALCSKPSAHTEYILCRKLWKQRDCF